MVSKEGCETIDHSIEDTLIDLSFNSEMRCCEECCVRNASCEKDLRRWELRISKFSIVFKEGCERIDQSIVGTLLSLLNSEMSCCDECCALEAHPAAQEGNSDFLNLLRALT